MNRRMWMKWAAAAPVYGVIGARSLSEKSLRQRDSRDHRCVSTARGAAVHQCSRHLDVPERFARTARSPDSHGCGRPALRGHVRAAARSRQRLAELSGAESGMVTSGAAGAMAVATAACMAGTDPAKVWQLPDTTGMKDEVVMLGGRSAFDSAIRLTGAKLVLVRTSTISRQPE